MNTAHGLVDGVLESAFLALKSDEVVLEIIVDLGTLEERVVGVGHFTDLVNFLFESPADKRCQIVVEGGDCLTSVHLVLDSLHRYAGEDGCGLDPLRGPGLSVTCLETVLENQVEGVLDASQGLGRIIILVVDMDVVLRHSLTDIFREKALVYISLR